MRNPKDNPLEPSVTVLVQLGSIVVHVDEMLSPKGHEFDRIALEALLKSPELRTWLTAMNALALLPVKR